MADILRVTTPLVPNTPSVQGPKAAQETGAVFNIQDTTRVQKSNPDSEMQQQNNTMLGQEMPTIMMNLLKDPSVTVTFLKNIFMLRDIVGLLSVNNETVTKELEVLFQALLVKPENIVSEMLDQGQDATIFNGKLFAMLKNLLEHNPGRPEVRGETINMLKSLSALMVQKDIIGAISNSLKFMAESTESAKTLSGKLMEMSERLLTPEAKANFVGLRTEIQALLKEVEGSILYSPKLEKIVSITSYNLSRFNDNAAFLQESAARLFEMLPDASQKQSFIDSIADFISNLGRSAFSGESGKELGEDLAKELEFTGKNTEEFIKDTLKMLPEGLQKREFADKIKLLADNVKTSEATKLGSKVMDILVKILEKQSQDETVKLLSSGKFEKIIESLLSSPCNFTPLLHFIIPVEYEDTKSFAEMWINPNGDEDSAAGGGSPVKSTHMLIVFDIANIGRFEAELYVKGDVIDLSLFCPPDYSEEFSGIGGQLKKSIQGLNYRFGDIRIDKLERSRSLIEVFTSLPSRRVGVDVKV